MNEVHFLPAHLNTIIIHNCRCFHSMKYRPHYFRSMNAIFHRAFLRLFSLWSQDALMLFLFKYFLFFSALCITWKISTLLKIFFRPFKLEITDFLIKKNSSKKVYFKKNTRKSNWHTSKRFYDFAGHPVLHKNISFWAA